VQIPIFSCYYCDYKTDITEDYERHNISNHSGRPAYPNEAEIEKIGLKVIIVIAIIIKHKIWNIVTRSVIIDQKSYYNSYAYLFCPCNR
jgi:hypothetical protein